MNAAAETSSQCKDTEAHNRSSSLMILFDACTHIYRLFIMYNFSPLPWTPVQELLEAFWLLERFPLFCDGGQFSYLPGFVFRTLEQLKLSSGMQLEKQQLCWESLLLSPRTRSSHVSSSSGSLTPLRPLCSPFYGLLLQQPANHRHLTKNGRAAV